MNFIYTGCPGNANNFKTYEECEQECQETSTEDGEFRDELEGLRSLEKLRRTHRFELGEEIDATRISVCQD